MPARGSKLKGAQQSPEVFDPPPIGFVPILVQEGLQVGRLIITAVAAAGLSTFEQTQDLREKINGRTPTRVNTDQEENDRKRVLKVSDAVQCVKEKLNSAAMTTLIYQIFLKMIISGPEGDIGAQLQELQDAIAECFRMKALQQNNPRIPETGTFVRRQS